MLKKQTDMRVVATIGNGENILQVMDKLNADIVLLDLGLRSQNSLEIVKLLKKDFPKTKIIVMDLVPLQADVFEFVQAGASGFILKDANVTDFFKTIRSVYEGAKVLPPHLTGSLFSQIVEYAIKAVPQSTIIELVCMTKREKQVVDLIADGATNKEIAQKLHLTPYTVNSHVHNILEKMALTTRVQIAKEAHFAASYKTAMDTTSLLSQ